ncbi:MAG: hypothetical protein IPN30_06495 [Flavobacteriales bacterium]|nr:hypothetical protein [Flavobacteriales bacterium]
MPSTACHAALPPVAQERVAGNILLPAIFAQAAEEESADHHLYGSSVEVQERIAARAAEELPEMGSRERGLHPSSPGADGLSRDVGTAPTPPVPES